MIIAHTYPSIILNISYESNHLILATTLWNRHHYQTLLWGETEAQEDIQWLSQDTLLWSPHLYLAYLASCLTLDCVQYIPNKSMLGISSLCRYTSCSFIASFHERSWHIMHIWAFLFSLKHRKNILRHSPTATIILVLFQQPQCLILPATPCAPVGRETHVTHICLAPGGGQHLAQRWQFIPHNCHCHLGRTQADSVEGGSTFCTL
jgi:hypothetical protein